MALTLHYPRPDYVYESFRKLLQGDLSEAWQEGEIEYATTALTYTLLDFTTADDGRVVDGSKTVSWYRGPFLPYATVPAFLAPPYVSPDQLMRFDPNSGMFDASYARFAAISALLVISPGATLAVVLETALG